VEEKSMSKLPTYSSEEKTLPALIPLGFAPGNRWHVDATNADLVRDRVAPRRATLPTTSQKITLDLSRTAILVIDMQNDFCHPDGWLASIGVDVSAARKPIAPLSKLLPLLRAATVPVIWVNWGNRPDKANLSPSVLHVYNPDGKSCGIGDALPRTGSPVLQKGAWSAATVDELPAAEQDICVDKFRMSGFWDTPLDSILSNLDVCSLLFAGVNLDQCVLATLIDANCLGYDCVLLDDCSATTSPDFCAEATLYNVRQCFGFVAHSADLISALGQQEGNTL
jgi:nicotinamidase-related amidase